MCEETFTISGTWSDVNRVREERLEFGKQSSHARLIKVLSRRSRVGLSLLFDHVKDRPSSGSSMRLRLVMVWLNIWASEAWKLRVVLFMCEAEKVKIAEE